MPSRPDTDYAQYKLKQMQLVFANDRRLEYEYDAWKKKNNPSFEEETEKIYETIVEGIKFRDKQDEIFRLRKRLKDKKRKHSYRMRQKQLLTPVRSGPVTSVKTPPKKMETRIPSNDYSAWEKYDVNKACEDVDKKELSKPSLDSSKSAESKNEKFQIESQYEKERGNNYVKQKKWDEAIACYTNAINLYKFDAVYFANRALCHLKKDNLHAAEADCTSALQLDPKYAKALLRRSTARERLGSLRRAAEDLGRLLLIEPDNMDVRRQLTSLIAKMGTKGTNFKSSTPSSPVDDVNRALDTILENCRVLETNDERRKSTGSIKSKSNPPIQHQTSLADISSVKTEKVDLNTEKQDDGEVIQPANKSPHELSKKPLVRVSLTEIPSGSSATVKSLKCKDKELTKILVNHLDKKRSNKAKTVKKQSTEVTVNNNCIKIDSDSNKTVDDGQDTEHRSDSNAEALEIDKLSVPKSSVQFVSDWRLLKGKIGARSTYLSAINPANIPLIFKNSMEGDIMSEILETIETGAEFNNETNFKPCMPYLIAITELLRFGTLVMFLSSRDKKAIGNILKRCKEKENAAEDQIKELSIKFEL